MMVSQTLTSRLAHISARALITQPFLQQAGYRIGLFLLTVSLLGLTGCNNLGLDKAELEESEQEYYKSAQKELKSGRFQSAIERLEALESRFPYGRYTEQAQLELIYAHYGNLDYTQTVLAAERFIRLHPDHPQLDYAYYAKGIASYQLDQGLFDKITPTDLSKRDMGAARESFQDFSEIVQRFPDSEYVDDARARMLYLRNRLADYEINVANYYMRRQAYLAAANRGQYVVKHFQKTPAVAPALAIMVKAYRKLELKDLARDTLAILVFNYPDYEELTPDGDLKAFRHVDDENPSWLNIVSFGLFG